MPAPYPGPKGADDDDVDDSRDHQGRARLVVGHLDHQEGYDALQPSRPLVAPDVDAPRQGRDHAAQGVGIEPEPTDDHRRLRGGRHQPGPSEPAGQKHEIAHVDDDAVRFITFDKERTLGDHEDMGGPDLQV